MSRRAVNPVVLLSSAMLCFMGFLALAAVAAQDRVFSLDYRVRSLVESTHGPLLDRAMAGVSLLGDNIGLIPLIAVATAVLWSRSRRWALSLPVLMAGTGALQWLAKRAVDRSRPNLADWGFPSGHVLSLVVFFGVVVYLLGSTRTTLRWRWPASAGCMLTVLAVAWSRLYLEMHWMSDVVGGFLLGAAYLLPAIWLLQADDGAAATAAVAIVDSAPRSQQATVGGAETLSVS